MYENLVRLIEEKGVAFGRFGDGVSEEAIAGAETDLGLRLPPSYRWWLRNYGGGQIGGDIVYGIDEESDGRADIRELVKSDGERSLQSCRQLTICIGNEESFCVDLSCLDDEGESPVLWVDGDSGGAYPYASSFAAFLERRIREFY